MLVMKRHLLVVLNAREAKMVMKSQMNLVHHEGMVEVVDEEGVADAVVEGDVEVHPLLMQLLAVKYIY
jgi:hypothetical protein